MNLMVELQEILTMEEDFSQNLQSLFEIFKNNPAKEMANIIQFKNNQEFSDLLDQY